MALVHSLFRPHLKAESDGFLDTVQRLAFCFALTDTARNGGTFNNPDSVFVPVNRQKQS